MERPMGVLTANDLTIAVMPCIRSSDHYLKKYGYMCRRPAGRKDWHFLFTLSGKGVVESEKETFYCKAGDMIVIPPDIPHFYYTEKNEGQWEKIWVHFIPRATWKPWLDITFSYDRIMYIQFEGSFQKEIEGAFRRMLDYYTGKFNVFKQELSLSMVEEIILMTANKQSENRGRQLDTRVEEVLIYLEEHYSELIQIDELAKMVHLSPSRLTHLFKQDVGESIIETLTKIRINQAAKLLRSTNHSIADIAYSVGFHSSNFFSRKFAGYYGENPMLYRKSRTTP